MTNTTFKLELHSHYADGTMPEFGGNQTDYEASGKGFYAETTDAPFTMFELRELVIKAENGIYMSNELFQLLNLDAAWGQDYYRVGNRKFQKVTQENLYGALEAACYERRSQREKDVQERNLGAIEWLINLM
jgi:hypothetical protein